MGRCYTYQLRKECPSCHAKTHTFHTWKISYTLYWIEFCKQCGWYDFVQRPFGEEELKLQIYAAGATDEELAIINKILQKGEEGKEGNWKQLS